MFDELFTSRQAIDHHSNSPLLEERLRYLAHCVAQGSTRSSLRLIAAYLLVFIEQYDLEAEHDVGLEEIQEAAKVWVGSRPQANGVTDRWYDRMAPSVLEDKDYYYGTATLAQVLLELGDDRAAEYFLSAQESIRNSFDLVTVAETRSKILIRLVAALCCLHSSDDAEAAKRYLGEASDLIEELPRLEGKICTVFSPLSKWNEEAEVIKRHIEWIREGRVFAWRERRSVTRHHPEAELATNSGNDVVQTCASSQKMARTETGQLVTSNRPKIVRRHDHRVLHAIAVESLRGSASRRSADERWTQRLLRTDERAPRANRSNVA